MEFAYVFSDVNHHFVEFLFTENNLLEKIER